MNITVENNNNIITATIIGSINSSNAGEFEAALQDYPSDTDGIVIDAKDLEYISSAGLRVILNAKKDAAIKYSESLMSITM